MAMETEKLLRSILMQVKMAESLSEAEIMIENLCNEDWVASANERVKEIKKKREKKQ